MKKLVLGLFLITGVSVVSFGQQANDRQYPAISKDVQRLQIKEDWYKPAQITTGDVAAVSSKGVHRISKKGKTQTTSVRTGGTPSWVISKGAARMQYEKNNRSN
jgi:hypothetical protein